MIKHQRAFTLIEVMIVVAIIAILAAIALPSYNDYIIRSKLTDAVNGMSTMRVQMEQYYLDNRTYLTSDTFTPPCLAPSTQGQFTIACEEGDLGPNKYVIKAKGVPGSVVADFQYSLDQQNLHVTLALKNGWGLAPVVNCWITSRGQTC